MTAFQCDTCNKRQPSRGIDGCFYELRDSANPVWQARMKVFGCERYSQEAHHECSAH